MRLLIVTQAVDEGSPTLGFFVEWLRAFAERCERLDVIALSVGAHDLPSNVRLFPLEKGGGTLARFLAYRKRLRLLLPACDGVFAHMCPEYVIAGWPLFALGKKRVALWFAHKARNWKVRLGAALSDVVVTSVPGAFTLASAKARPIGQGVPTGLFAELPPPPPPFRFAAVGRITPIKRLELLIGAMALLKARGLDARLELWGSPALEADAAYEKSLRRLAEEKGVADRVVFVGAVPYADMPARYRDIAIGLNACPDGAIDKAVLEAMACARPVVVTNANFKETLGEDAEACLARPEAEAIAEKVEALLSAERAAIGKRLRASVETRHGLSRLIGSILRLYGTP